MINGIINVYKEAGFTSHDVVAKLRGIFGQKKIGHTGTLDPDAEGVLLVCLGKATKVCDLLTEKDKTYRCVMRLGIRTDTQDMSGNILSETVPEVTEDQVQGAIMKFVGDYQQIPPMYSALKVDGKRLYELARAGKEVTRQPRPVRILRIRIQEIVLPKVTMEVSCSKGTYIRTLCNDIGETLGCGACMEHLVRTRSGSFEIADSHTLGELEQLVKEGKVQEALLPVDTVFFQYPKAVAGAKWGKLLENGNCLPVSALEKLNGSLKETPFRLYDASGKFAGIYQLCGSESEIRPIKIFWEKD